ncbi:urea amidolyase associated protein UAAP1 [Alkalihalophilus sp. As8PL]|uniref:Urea amidolyase associated protein UAAP1 n=1 Tax=Alkalihalophilus sp. As8PL TaxID=3237103 RepID=A0AB39BXE2_9BACI
MNKHIWNKVVPAGGKWSGAVKKGNLIRFTALEEGANLSVLLFNLKETDERYNMPDTLKAQHTAHLTTGHVLMSDNGRAMASIIEDDLGWHDTISGYSTRVETDKKYGKTTFQEQRNEWYRSGEENFMMELVRNGLGNRDLVPNVNLFSKVFCDEQGDMNFEVNHCAKGTSVTLRTEMDLLVVISNTPNRLDSKETFPSVPVEIEVLSADEVQEDDYCLNYRPENRRAFENTWEYNQLLGI